MEEIKKEVESTEKETEVVTEDKKIETESKVEKTEKTEKLQKDNKKESKPKTIPEDRFYINDKLPKEVDQNTSIASTLKINSEKEELREVITKNPSLGDYKTLRQKLSTSKESNTITSKGGVSTMSYSNHTPEEEPLLHKRDWYRVWGNEGKHFPEDTDLSVLQSPQKGVNLALDQVRTLVLAGFRLQNNRTGDVINKRRLDKYIANWSKDKNPIL